MWRCEDVDQQMWRCRDVDQQMWRCEDVDQQMWRCEDVDQQMWRREDVLQRLLFYEEPFAGALGKKGRIPHSLLRNILPMVPSPKLKGRIPPEASAEKFPLSLPGSPGSHLLSPPGRKLASFLVKTKTECQVESQIMSGCMSGCMSDTMPDEMSTNICQIECQLVGITRREYFVC